MAGEVTAILRQVAATEVVPRFGRLRAGEAQLKAPRQWVTTADRAAEAQLSARLTALLPGSVVVGEEAVAADPATIDRLAAPGPVWLVDPLDGTENFVRGSPHFTLLVSLIVAGQVVAGWTHAPLLDLTATAMAGRGAFVDGTPIRVRGEHPGLSGMAVAAPDPSWWSDDLRAGMAVLRTRGAGVSYFDNSSLEYVELSRGRRDAVVINWPDVWDHAAGLLLLAEAGGVAMTADGRPWDVTIPGPMPLVAASSPAGAERVHAVLSLRAQDPRH